MQTKNTADFDFDLDCSLLRYIVPFNYEDVSIATKLKDSVAVRKSKKNINSNIHIYDLCIEKLSLAGWKKVEEFQSYSDIYSFVLNTIYKDKFTKKDDFNLGSSWEFSLPDEISLFWNHVDKDTSNYEIKISKCGIFLFHTGIGLFWYELNTNITNPNELIDFQISFKELAAKWQNIRFQRILENGLKSYFVAGQWIAEVIESALGKVIYYPYKVNPLIDYEQTELIPISTDKLIEYIPDKAILYNYMGINEDQLTHTCSVDDLTLLSFYLTNGFDKKFYCPKDINSKVFKPFNNTLWYTTSCGCGQYAIYNDHDGGFFKNTKTGMRNRMEYEYFFIYIFILYQKYSLVAFSSRLESSFPTDIDEISFASVQRHLQNINLFLVKSIHSSISNLEQQNAVYNYISDALSIDKNVRGLTIGLESLENIARELAQDEEQKSNEAMQRSLSSLSLLIITSALTDLYSVLDENIPDLCGELFGGAQWTDAYFYSVIKAIFAILFIVIFFIALFSCVSTWFKFFKNKRKNKILYKK